MSVEPQGNEQEAIIRRRVREVAEAAGILVKFAPGRRRTDIVIVVLRGARYQVLSLPLQLAEELPEFDLEIMRSDRQDEGYSLMLAVTEKLERQEPRLELERRAKLRRRLEEVLLEIG